MFLLPHQGAIIENIVKLNPDYDVIGCSTNRLGDTFQLWNGSISEDPNITNHQIIADEAYKKYGISLETVSDGNYLAGIFYLFRKSLWNEIPFEEKSIQFDLLFMSKLYKEGKKLAIARGLYLFHIYRLGTKDPRKKIGHLVHCQDFAKIKDVSEIKMEGKC